MRLRNPAQIAKGLVDKFTYYKKQVTQFLGSKYWGDLTPEEIDKLTTISRLYTEMIEKRRVDHQL